MKDKNRWTPWDRGQPHPDAPFFGGVEDLIGYLIWVFIFWGVLVVSFYTLSPSAGNIWELLLLIAAFFLVPPFLRFINRIP